MCKGIGNKHAYCTYENEKIRILMMMIDRGNTFDNYRGNDIFSNDKVWPL